jgi:hypothetical protein
MNHIDDEADHYALGLLEDDERARVDAHLATCAACTERVGAAEAVVAGLIDATQRAPQARMPRWPYAVAAAFALASGLLLGQNVFMRGALDGDGTVLATLVNSHFDHAQFQTAAGAPIGAKAIYERHGEWFEILVDGAPAWRVIFVRADGTRDPALGGFARRGAASVLTATPAGRVRTVELEDAEGHIVGTVRPALQAEQE